MFEIGENVVVLRHPMVRKGGRGFAVVLVLGPIVVVALIVAADFVFNTHVADFVLKAPMGSSHLPSSAGAIMFGAYLVSALIGLPGLLLMRRERLTEELHVGTKGLELRQVLTGVAGGKPMVSWRIAWTDVTQARLRYRNHDGWYAGVDIRTRGGMQQRLYALAWEPVTGKSPADIALPRSWGAIDPDVLRATSLVRTLTLGGLQIEDETPRPQDRFAAWLGVGLCVGATVAAMIFSYFVEH